MNFVLGLNILLRKQELSKCMIIILIKRMPITKKSTKKNHIYLIDCIVNVMLVVCCIYGRCQNAKKKH